MSESVDQSRPNIVALRRAQPDFEALVRPHLDYLHRIAWRFTGATDRAEDLIQELLLRLYPRRGELAHIEQLRPWLVRVLYRLFIDEKRRYARSPLVAIEDSDFAPADNDGDSYAEIADSAPGPEQTFEQNFNRECLMQAWERLGADHKVLLTLHDIEGYTLNELEVLLETTRGTLKSRLHRARARLRELLGMEPFGDTERVEGRS